MEPKRDSIDVGLVHAQTICCLPQDIACPGAAPYPVYMHVLTLSVVCWCRHVVCSCSRFQPVTVPEPSIDETYEILQVSVRHVDHHAH
jgi:hypothetical protein